MKANRYEEISTIFSGNLYENCVDNLLSLMRLILLQKDEAPWNALPVSGMFYSISIVFLIIGVYVSIKKYRENIYNNIMGIWMIASIAVAAFCIININRINIIMIPSVYYIILGIYEIFQKYKTMIPCIIIIYAVMFIMFIHDYWKQDFNEYFTFTSGVQEVVEYCEASNEKDVYCYYSFKEPFIYFMFYSEADVNEYLGSVTYFSDDGVFDNIKSFGKYKFYLPAEIGEDMIIIVPEGATFDGSEKCLNKMSINQFDIYEF